MTSCWIIVTFYKKKERKISKVKVCVKKGMIYQDSARKESNTLVSFVTHLLLKDSAVKAWNKVRWPEGRNTDTG